jgi:hypothetical protein
LNEPAPLITVGDIAKLAKVSRTTVSLALRNSPRISEKVCTKVQAVARKLEYWQNPLVTAHMSYVRSLHPRYTGQCIALVGNQTFAQIEADTRRPLHKVSALGSTQDADLGGVEVVFRGVRAKPAEGLGRKTDAAGWPVAMTSDSVAVAEPPRADNAPPQARGSLGGGQGQWQRPTWAQFLERNDANKAGKVMRDELKGPPRIFEMLDRNKDRVIVKEEHKQPGRN